MDKTGYLHSRQEQQAEVSKTDFWKDFISAIDELRKTAVNRCLDNKNINSVQYYQGQVYTIDRILEIPDKLKKEQTTSDDAELL